MGVLEDYESAHQSFRSGSVMHENSETLLKHLSGLSNQNNINEGTQHRDIIRGITINHILLQRHIDSLNRQNEKMQFWVIVLAIAALISSVVQIFSPVLFREPPTASPQQKQAPQSVSSSQASPPSSGQATKKAP